MLNRKIFKYFTCLFIFMLINTLFSQKNSDYTKYVNPFIGTDGHAHTFPGASLPFGMVQLSPDTDTKGWDWCSGYHFKDTSIMGFSHTHLSGTGASDYGDIMFMPTTGKLLFLPGSKNDPDSGYRSRFDHNNENASAGYYSVILDDYDISAEFTVTKRAGFHKYTFPESKSSNLIIDLTHGIHDKTSNCYIEFLNNEEITGFRRSYGWSNDHCFYFIAKFSKPFETFGTVKNDKINNMNKKSEGKNIKAYVRFNTKKNEPVYIKVGISAVSIEGARKNLEKEIPHWDFNKIRSDAKKSWNEKLKKIEINSSSEDKLTTFYTSLYHCMIAPNTFMDVDKRYMGMDGQIHQADDFINHTVFSLWDTFRALHPLFTIIEQKRTVDFIKTMLKKYEQSGLLPVWELAAQETNCMIGYHSIPVITDAYIKGIKNFNIHQTYKAMKVSADQDHYGLKFYKKYGYIPAQSDHESVSKTLEYAYDDWCIAQIAKKLKLNDDYEFFLERSLFYKNLFDKSVGFMRARKHGKWFEPFDPKSVSGNYTEANAWQYSFFVPHDIKGLIKLYGGDSEFTDKLDKMFAEKKNLTGRQQSDITGLIGQYAHGNEPSHHMGYLYNYAGMPWKTQSIVRDIMDLYTHKRDGLCGNEDCGQMSAWYIFSSLGFYPVCPGDDSYAIGSPIFKEAVINLENGKTFTISALDVSKKNKYIQSVILNGENYNKSFIKHGDIIKGGTIEFTMSSTPNKKWGLKPENRPFSRVNKNFTSSPFFLYDHITFYDEQEIKIRHHSKNAIIFYTLDGTVPTKESILYKNSLKINNTTTLKAIAFLPDKPPSKTISAYFKKIPFKRSIKLKTEYAPQYSAGGDNALIDYMRGSNNFWSGAWQGYHGVNIEAVIDLGKPINIEKISTGFLQDINAWIFMPLNIEYHISMDGRKFKKISLVKNTVSEKKSGIIIKNFKTEIKEIQAQYIKILAKNRIMCPEWHKGHGGKAWIFADEITIN